MKHPGVILLEEYMQPRGLSQNGLARDLRISPQRVNEIIKGNRRITTDTALRLSRYFGTSAFFWLDLQARHDIELAEESGLVDQIYQQVHIPPDITLQRSQRGHSRIEDRILRTHQLVAEKLKQDPEGVIGRAWQNIRRWGWDKEETPAPYMRAWMALLQGPITELEKVLTGTGERAVLLRSSSPFAGVFSELKPATLGTEAIKATLRNHLDDLRNRYGVTRFGLFGSYARGEQHAESDIDLLVDFSEPVGYFTLMKLEGHMSSLLGAKVDLTTYSGLKSSIGQRILEEIQYIE